MDSNITSKKPGRKRNRRGRRGRGRPGLSNRLPLSSSLESDLIEPTNNDNVDRDCVTPVNGNLRKIPDNVKLITVYYSDSCSPDDDSTAGLIKKLVPDQSSFDFGFFSKPEQKEEKIRQLQLLIKAAREYVSNQKEDLVTNSYASLTAIGSLMYTQTDVETDIDTVTQVEMTALEMLKLFCLNLNVNLQTLFASIELYNRFVISDLEKEEKKDDIPLRIATCILIASIIHTDAETRDIRIPHLKILLDKYQEWYFNKHIHKSQVDVFSSLGFRCSWAAPFEILEHVLTLMELDVETKRKTYTHSMHILLLAYKDHQRLYDSLWEIRQFEVNSFNGTSRDLAASTDTERARMEFKSNVEMDLGLRCGGIVATALLLLNPETNGTSSRDYFQEIAQLISTDRTDLMNITIAFFYVVTDSENSSIFE